MPDGGSITLATDIIISVNPIQKGFDLNSGDYIRFQYQTPVSGWTVKP